MKAVVGSDIIAAETAESELTLGPRLLLVVVVVLLLYALLLLLSTLPAPPAKCTEDCCGWYTPMNRMTCGCRSRDSTRTWRHNNKRTDGHYRRGGGVRARS